MIYLDELLRGERFHHKVAGLARPLRERFVFPPLHQLGIVVPDVGEAAAVLETDGFGPFFMARGAPVVWQEKDGATGCPARWGWPITWGLKSNCWSLCRVRTFTTTRWIHPVGRWCSICFLLKDVDRWGKKLARAGLGVWVWGQLKTGPVKTDFAYIETLEDEDLIMEFISWRCFGRWLQLGPAIAHTIGRIQQWTGKRCWSL